MLQRLRTPAGPFFVFAGATPFVAPRPHRAIVPRWLVATLLAVFIASVLGAAPEKERAA